MGLGRIVLARPTSVRLTDEQSGAWMILAWDTGSSSVTITRVRRRPPSTGAPPIVSRNIVARESEWTGSNGHRGAASPRSGEVRRPTDRAYSCLLPGVGAGGMFCAHKRGEKIPAKSAQTAPSHCDHHMFTNCRVPTPRWKTEEMPDAFASPLSHKGPAEMARYTKTPLPATGR
jgi:hypothetical protein